MDSGGDKATTECPLAGNEMVFYSEHGRHFQITLNGAWRRWQERTSRNARATEWNIQMTVKVYSLVLPRLWVPTHVGSGHR
jgi:hypothetical protein